MSYEILGLEVTETFTDSSDRDTLTAIGDSTTGDRPLSHGTPARRLFGVLPLARVVPQDIHSVLDYMNGATTLAATMISSDPVVIGTSVSLGASAIGASAMSDYRLSVARVIPIEVHEAIDYVWSASAIALPFALGYWKKNPIAAALHIGAGLLGLGVSLITDYRAYKGVGRR